MSMRVWGQSQGADTSKVFLEEAEMFEFQTKKGSLYAGAVFGVGLGVRSEELNLSTGSALGDAMFNPKVGFYVVDRLQAGISVDMFGSFASISYAESHTLSYYTFNPYVRYYLKSGFFGETQMGWGRGSEQVLNDNEILVKSPFEIQHFSVGAGLGNFWFKQLSLELLLRYTLSSGEFEDTGQHFFIHNLSMTAGIGLHLGRIGK
ncbi:hypothetical protein AAG747_12180 [Rapidithrix thailandica]|uniref:Outer membrane protein beta-barrel domain-containing protein n=1 Tax=Rapidithrix thailandica TaxID=413964 RepID=A0AAW9SBG1_9BACT